ncbi:MAG: methylmalonyl Co-A mutase-associated GTPase MeaB [Rhodothermales bacterium]
MAKKHAEQSDESALHLTPGVDSVPSINPHLKQQQRRPLLPLDAYLQGIREGDRVILSQAITLIESTRHDHQELGQEILNRCLPQTGRSIRVGITGVPGVGKSTFIESLGNHLISNGRRLAVLAIDPTSARTQGSILGDKTRMPTLSANPNAFVRPSPTAGSLGGVARATRETIFLCEAAGYDTIFVETVGVGQSEVAVHGMVDFFLLLVLAGAGDELQGIKRGIIEMADAIAVTKADGANVQHADDAVADYRNALTLFPPKDSGWKPNVLTCSALTGDGLPAIWDSIESFSQKMKQSSFWKWNRQQQARAWMMDTIKDQLREHFFSHPDVRKTLTRFEQDVVQGRLSSFAAARELISIYLSDQQEDA